MRYVCCFANSQDAISALAAELAEAQLLLDPGQMPRVAVPLFRCRLGNFQMLKYSRLRKAEMSV